MLLWGITVIQNQLKNICEKQHQSKNLRAAKLHNTLLKNDKILNC